MLTAIAAVAAALATRRLDRSDVYAVRADGTGVRLLFRSASAPAWRP
jgi:hypothetical protein